MIYYIIMSVLWVFAILECWRRKDSLKVLLPFSFIMIWLFVGLRWETGTDWNAYVDHYRMLPDIGFEFGYVKLAAVSKALGFSYSAFLLLISFVPLFAMFYFLVKKSPYVFAALMFFAANYMLGFMGGNRQAIAIGIILFSNIYIEKKRPVQFLLIVCAASLFHSSAAVYLPAYFMAEKRVPIIAKYIIIGILVAFGKESAPVLLKVLRTVLDSTGFHGSAAKVSAYINQIVFYGYTWSSLIKKVALLIAFDLFFSRMLARDKNAVLYTNLYFFAILIDSLFGPINVVFMRAGTYYRIVEIILVAKILETINRKELKFLALIALFAYCIRQIYAGISFYPDLFIPYKSILP